MSDARSPSDPVRRRLLALVFEHRTSLAAVSRGIGRNHAYLHQFVYRGIPRRLPELIRQALAEHFHIDESELLVPDERQRREKQATRVDSEQESAASRTETRAKLLNSFAARLAVARAESPHAVPSSFAAATGIQPSRYSELEDGEDDPTLDELDRIAHASGKSLDWLIRGDDVDARRRDVVADDHGDDAKQASADPLGDPSRSH